MKLFVNSILFTIGIVGGVYLQGNLEIIHQENSISNFLGVIDTCACCDDCNSRWKDMLSERNNELSSKNSKISNLELEQGFLKKNNSTLTEQLREAKEEIKELKRKLKAKETEINNLLKKLREQNDTLYGLKLERDNLRDSLKVFKENNQDPEKIRDLQDKLNALNGRYHELDKSFTDQNDFIDSLKVENEVLKAEEDRLIEEFGDIVNFGTRKVYFDDNEFKFKNKNRTETILHIPFNYGSYKLDFEKGLSKKLKRKLERFSRMIKRFRKANYKIELKGWCSDNQETRSPNSIKRANCIKQILIDKFGCIDSDFEPFSIGKVDKLNKVDISIRFRKK